MSTVFEIGFGIGEASTNPGAHVGEVFHRRISAYVERMHLRPKCQQTLLYIALAGTTRVTKRSWMALGNFLSFARVGLEPRGQ